MIAIEKTLISDDLRDVRFVCDLESCHGACCVEGDAGAPLQEDEINEIEEALEEIKEYMTPEGIEVVGKSGVFDYDMFGHLVTPLVHDRDCAFVYYEGETAKCAIEKAYLEGKITYRKPISCHLYPVRISGYPGFEAVNYHEWHICKDALIKGKAGDVPLYVFLKDPLVRKFGKQWYESLEKEIRKQSGK